MLPTRYSSRIVNWAAYLAISAFLALPLAVLMVRAGAWKEGLLLYALGCLFSLILLACCAVLLCLPRFSGQRRSILLFTLVTLPGSILLLSMLAARNDYPLIHDISTDTIDPPAFVTAAQRRPEDANSLAVKPETIEAQLQTYPDIQTLRSRLSKKEAFDSALTTAAELGWEIHHEDRDAGIIEAVDTTRIMAFQDDIVIRLREAEEETQIDLRSVSRVGRGDFGANAARIRAFQQVFPR